MDDRELLHQTLLAYANLWKLIDSVAKREKLTDDEAMIVYTGQPEAVWDALRARGLDPTAPAPPHKTHAIRESLRLSCGCEINIGDGGYGRSLCSGCAEHGDRYPSDPTPLRGLRSRRLFEALQRCEHGGGRVGSEELLAEHLDWPLEDVQATCGGRLGLDLDDVIKWAEFCGVSVLSLFDGAERIE